MKKLYINILLLLLSLSSCIPKKEVIYLQGINNNQNPNESNYEPLIQKDDLLYINISTDEPSAAAPFNLDTQAQATGGGGGLVIQKQTYLVDGFGNIDFPILGKINVASYSIDQVKKDLKDRLAVYLINPIINIRIMNFKVTVLGEVNKPGEVTVSSQRLTLLEALGKAGDLTIYGKRDNVLVVRDFQGQKTFNRVDITRADFINSPFYYLDQNDVVYVEPRKSKIDSAAIGSNVTTIISIASFIIGLTLIFTK